MISISLSNIFRNAVKFAKENRHENLTLEHVFLSILKSDEGKDFLTEVGGNITSMEEYIENYIKVNNPEMEELNKEGTEYEPYETVTLSNTLNDMVSHINSSGRSEAKIGDLLASIFTQTKSYAYAVLQAEGITRLAILEIISIEKEIKESSSSKTFTEKREIPLISKVLNNIFREAVSYAKERRHEYLTPEHIFLSILKSEEGMMLISSLSENIEEIKKLIESYLLENNPIVDFSDEYSDPYETVTLSNIMNEMITNINKMNTYRASPLFTSLLEM